MENGKLKSRRWCDLHAPRTAGAGANLAPQKGNMLRWLQRLVYVEYVGIIRNLSTLFNTFQN